MARATDAFSRHAQPLILVGYLLATAAFLASTSLPAHHAWALTAAGAYAASLAFSMRPTLRHWAPWVALIGSALLPLAILAVRHQAQPEVQVLVDGARSLVTRATPYVARPGDLAEVRPYLPGLFVFGLPGVLGLPGLLGDPRVWMDGAFTVAILGVLRLEFGRWDRRWLAWTALFGAMPLMALSWSVSAIDLPLTAAALVAAWALHRGRVTVAVVASVAALTTKPTAAALVLMLAAGLARRGCLRQAGAYLVSTVVATVAVLVPFAVRDPGGMLDNVIRFPAGLGEIGSPAQSPFPGVLLAHATGPTIPTILAAVSLVVGMALATRRSARGLWDLLNLLACTFTAIYLLAPNSRAGYLVLPATLCFVAWAIKRWNRATEAAP